jgi:MFS family permease
MTAKIDSDSTLLVAADCGGRHAIVLDFVDNVQFENTLVTVRVASTQTKDKPNWRTPAVVLICAGLIVTLSMGLRHGFGLFLQPMTTDLGLTRQNFAFALGMQNLAWGLAQPFVGMIADRFGVGRVLAVGAVLYVLGLIFMSMAQSALGLSLSAGILIGLGLSGTTFSIVFGAVGRAVAPKFRSKALGIVGAAGSFGQFMMVPGTHTLIAGLGWASALLILAMMAALIMPLAAGLAEYRKPTRETGVAHQSIMQALREAFSHSGFKLLTLGYFVCGFQVVFIGVHLPSYILDKGLSAKHGMIALALIGLCNVIGSYSWGSMGAYYSKKNLLSLIYTLRGVVIAVFLLIPISPMSVYLFAAGIGLLWLGTVPLTSAVVAQIFGVKYLSMLSGFVFLSHQLGSFVGAWFGGYMFDKTGSYQVVWIFAIALSVVAALANWPIDERPVARLKMPESVA